MSKFFRPQAVLSLGLLVSAALAFQNCAKAEFALDSESASFGLDSASLGGSGSDGSEIGDSGSGNAGPGSSGSGGSSSGGTGSGSTPGGSKPPDVNVICDPFGSSTLNKPGIMASLVYYDGPDPKQEIKGLADIFGKGTRLADTVILFSAINVPTRSFEQGFDIGGGEKLKAKNGQRLIEWFGLDYSSNLSLMPSEEDGLYQMATISDDGSVLYLDSGSGLQAVVNNDGYASTRMVCGSVISIKKGDLVPMRMQYFQGPANEIAVNLLWRKVSSATAGLQDSYCGTQGGFFSSSGTTAKMNQLKANGWKILSPGNFVLRETIPNSCK